MNADSLATDCGNFGFEKALSADCGDTGFRYALPGHCAGSGSRKALPTDCDNSGSSSRIQKAPPAPCTNRLRQLYVPEGLEHTTTTLSSEGNSMFQKARKASSTLRQL